MLKTLGFSGVPRSGTLFAKKLLVFRGSVRSHPFISSLGKTSSHLYLDKGVSFWGVFWEKTLQTRDIFSCRVMPFAPMRIRSAVLHGCSQKGSLTLLPQHEGRKNDTFFQIFLNFFRRPISVRPACRIVAYTGNGRRTHNRKAARLIPDRDKQAADD